MYQNGVSKTFLKNTSSLSCSTRLKLKIFRKIIRKIRIISKTLFIFFILISIAKAELLKPNSDIKPDRVIEIQLSGLQNNDLIYKDSGIEQTWNFAHPNNKKVTGPLDKFKRMIKGDSYQMMINHLSHTITKLGSGENWAQFEVILLDKDKIYHKFNWQVEKYETDGPLKDCWLTTMVSSPIPLGSSILSLIHI